MKDDIAREGPELDVLKFYIWLMVVMTVVLGVLFWFMWKGVEETRKTVAQGRSWLKEYAEAKVEIQGMLNVYKNNKEDEARERPLTWFSSIWRRKGIPETSITIGAGAWKDPPDYRAKGNYEEEKIELKFQQKDPLTREQIAAFCHEVERSSTRLRIIELELHRASKDNMEEDRWYGKVLVGYRHARLSEAD